jgi:NitT/TauT family transport system substrate-binding protein
VALWQLGRPGLKIMAGVASGGAELVVRPGITSARQLAHARVAAPAGSAQEVALDYWLRQNGIAGAGPGSETMTAAYLAGALKSGRLAGAWEPAPVDAEMAAAGGHVLVDEASLWPGGRFATSVLVVTDTFLARHAAAVGLLLRAQVQAVQFTASDRTAAEHAVNLRLAATAGPALPSGVLDQAFGELRFSVDPLAVSILGEAQHAVVEGLLSPVSGLGGLFDLGPLNSLLKASGLHPVRT